MSRSVAVAEGCAATALLICWQMNRDIDFCSSTFSTMSTSVAGAAATAAKIAMGHAKRP